MSEDMELSCDESVVKKMGSEIKKSYATSLLTLATERHILNVSPLAFRSLKDSSSIKFTTIGFY